MLFGHDFLELQIGFAERIVAVTGLSLEDALFTYTPLATQFGVPFVDHRKSHPCWQRFLELLHEYGTDDLNATIDACQQRLRPPLEDAPPKHPWFGCFSLDYYPESQVVRLHFGNRDAPEPGVLSAARADRRRAELRELMGHIRSRYPEARTVLGRSWLYNLAAYRRLYPPPFLATLTALPIMHTGLSLWGQLLDRHGHVKREAGARFLERVAAATTLDALNACFPLEILRAECSVAEFYRFYGLEERPPRS